MAHITSQSIVDIIKVGPYAVENLRFFAGKQAFAYYPYVEVIETSPMSENEQAELATEEQGFEILFHTRYAREVSRELTLIEGVETQIQTLLKAATFEHGELFYEDRRWSRTPLRGEDSGMFGNTSTLRLSFREYSATESGTQIGAGSTLTVDGTVLNLIRSSTGTHGRNSGNVYNDEGFRAPTKGGRVNTRMFQYAYKETEYDTVQSLCDDGDIVSVTLTQGADVTTWANSMCVTQRDSVDYAGLKIVTLEVQIEK